jgi:hypothetical protein
MKKLTAKEIREIAEKENVYCFCVSCAEITNEEFLKNKCSNNQCRKMCKGRLMLQKKIKNYILSCEIAKEFCDFVDNVVLQEFSKKLEKPKRDKIINQDDITDLKIALNTSKTFEEFLEVV